MIGLSILSGSHRELIPDVLDALREAGGGEIPVVVGGIIPEADAEPLRAAGVAAVYTPKDFELDPHPARRRRARGGAQRDRRRGVSGGDDARAGGGEAAHAGGGEAARSTAAAELGARLRERDLSRRARGAQPAREPLARPPRRRSPRCSPRWRPAALGGEAAAHVVGVTGPPGAGKSTLLSALVRVWRARGRTVGVLAVDPSSKRSGGALLGDRARIDADPSDRGVFIRSMAAGERLGGLAPATRAAAQALAAAFDVVVVETVGVGQSETEVAEAADTVAVVVQPGSGDVLQFLKAGIMEVPDVLVVTKSDLGTVAQRARPRPARGAALARRRRAGRARSPRSTRSRASRSSPTRSTQHRAGLDLAATPPARPPRSDALADYVAEHGERGLRTLGGRRAAERFLAEQDAALEGPALVRALEQRAADPR